jgi:rod shape-determining protein MreC
MRDSARQRPIRLLRPSPYRSLTLVIALIVLALLLVVLDQAGMLGTARAQAQTLLTPILRMLRQVSDGVSGVGQGLTEVTQLRDRVAELEAKNSQLEAQNLQVQELQLQLSRLEAQLRIEKERPWQLLGADVSTRTPDGGRRIVMLAAGSQQGVKPGMAVIGKEGGSPPALIGVVENVGPRSSSVLLITDYSSSISAQIYHNDGVISGVVQGQWQLGSRLRLEGVERVEPLAVGDVVVTAGLTARLDASLPRAAILKDIPIGTIQTIQVDGHSQFADIRPYVDPDRVSYAWVLISQDE